MNGAYGIVSVLVPPITTSLFFSRKMKKPSSNPTPIKQLLVRSI